MSSPRIHRRRTGTRRGSTTTLQWTIALRSRKDVVSLYHSTRRGTARYACANTSAPTALIEEHAGKQSPSRVEELVKIFVQATRVRVWRCIATPLANCLCLSSWRRGSGIWRPSHETHHSMTQYSLLHRGCDPAYLCLTPNAQNQARKLFCMCRI